MSNLYAITIHYRNGCTDNFIAGLYSRIMDIKKDKFLTIQLEDGIIIHINLDDVTKIVIRKV